MENLDDRNRARPRAVDQRLNAFKEKRRVDVAPVRTMAEGFLNVDNDQSGVGRHFYGSFMGSRLYIIADAIIKGARFSDENRTKSAIGRSVGARKLKLGDDRA